MASTSTTGGSLDVPIAREEALRHFRDINWATYTRAGDFSLDQAEISALKEVESIAKPGKEDANASAINEFLNRSGTGLAQSLLKVIANVTEPSVVNYALARMEQLLPDGLKLQTRIRYFLSDSDSFDPAPFLRLVRHDSGYTQYAAGRILALFLTVKPLPSTVEALCQWAVQTLKLGSSTQALDDPERVNTSRAAIASIMVLLRQEKARSTFVHQSGVPVTVEMLQNAQHRPQLSYELLFVLWTLSFGDVAVESLDDAEAVNVIVKLVTAAPREKVVRVGLETLQNLLGKRGGRFNERMIDDGFLKTLTTMQDRKWVDEDITKSIREIRQVLYQEYKELNTMERYEKEVRTGKLSWGFLHTDKFWQDNFMSFEKSDFELVRMLVALLESDDTKTVAVALFDLGEFVRYYPNGKHMAKRLGAKKAAMRLMTHDDAEVQKQALQSTSKMMVNKWEAVK